MLKGPRKYNSRKILGSLIIGAVTGIFFGPAVGIFFGGVAYGLSHAANESRCAFSRQKFVPERVGGYRLSHKETKAPKQATARSNISQVRHSEKSIYGKASTPLVRVSLRLNSSLPSGNEKVTSPKTLDEAIRRLIQA